MAASGVKLIASSLAFLVRSLQDREMERFRLNALRPSVHCSGQSNACTLVVVTKPRLPGLHSLVLGSDKLFGY